MSAAEIAGQLALILFALTIALMALRIAFIPLALTHEIRDRRRRRRGDLGALAARPPVSVVVPAHDEETVIESCLRSILGCGYPDLEIIVVDDGSTDRTEEIVRRVRSEDERVRCVVQNNAGKGAALNTGFRVSSYEYVLFIDADTVFTTGTVPQMLRAFHSEDVGAVCGDDRPVNLDRVLTRFLALITHVGTALTRRAFDVLGVVPVVSGNCGAFRRAALEEVMSPAGGPLREDTVGEDLELTWRLHRSRWQVAFAPRALVLAESPSTLAALWGQRVRWARGLLQGIRMHRDVLASPGYGRFWAFLLYTVVTMVIYPVTQVLVLAGIAGWSLTRAARTGESLRATDALVVLGLIGIVLSLLLLVVAMSMSRSLRDLRHLWTVPLWPLYSIVISATMLRALRLEAGGSGSTWSTPARTGVISHERHTALFPTPVRPAGSSPGPARG